MRESTAQALMITFGGCNSASTVQTDKDCRYSAWPQKKPCSLELSTAAHRCSHACTQNIKNGVTDLPGAHKGTGLLHDLAAALLVPCVCGIHSQQEVLRPAYNNLLRQTDVCGP